MKKPIELEMGRNPYQLYSRTSLRQVPFSLEILLPLAIVGTRGANVAGAALSLLAAASRCVGFIVLAWGKMEFARVAWGPAAASDEAKSLSSYRGTSIYEFNGSWRNKCSYVNAPSSSCWFQHTESLFTFNKKEITVWIIIIIIIIIIGCVGNVRELPCCPDAYIGNYLVRKVV